MPTRLPGNKANPPAVPPSHPTYPCEPGYIDRKYPEFFKGDPSYPAHDHSKAKEAMRPVIVPSYYSLPTRHTVYANPVDKPVIVPGYYSKPTRDSVYANPVDNPVIV